MPSPILARADALMQRRRQASTEVNDVPTLTDAIDPESDVPLLIDVEENLPAQGASPAPAPIQEETPAHTAATATTSPDVLLLTEPVPAAPPVFSETTPSHSALSALSEELARRVTARLQAALPGIVASVVADFLAEQADKENNAAR